MSLLMFKATIGGGCDGLQRRGNEMRSCTWWPHCRVSLQGKTLWLLRIDDIAMRAPHV